LLTTLQKLWESLQMMTSTTGVRYVTSTVSMLPGEAEFHTVWLSPHCLFLVKERASRSLCKFLQGTKKVQVHRK
jgi:hypothetical protein